MEPKNKIRFFDVVRFAAGYWKQQPVKLTFIILLSVLAAVVETNIPNSFSAFLGAARQNADADSIWFYLALFLLNYAGHIALFGSVSVIYNSFETNIFKKLVDDAFTHVHRLSEQFFINTFTGAIISKISRGRQRIESFEDQILLRLLPAAVILAGSIVFLGFRFPFLALLVIVFISLLILASLFIVFRYIGPFQEAYANAQDIYGAHLADSITGIPTTKAYAQEKLEKSRFYDVTENLRQKNARAYIFSSVAGWGQQLLLTVMLMLLLGGGTWYFIHGKASVEDMAYLALAYSIIHSYVRSIGDIVKNLLTSSYDLHAIIEFLNEEPGVKDVSGAPALAVGEGSIVFDNVTFAYPGKQMPIFKDFTLTIRGGERVALVGHSGSGKTTFIRLLQRLYDVGQGRISVDGQDIRLCQQTSLRRAIAVVPQDPILFHRTLHENIAYGNPSATLEDVRAAARKAHIEDFIMSLPEQYDTLVGERGIKLSGGERQRVAIARAILADRPLLILDEATSSLDSASERSIQDALHALIQGRTSIMVAHRLSTILGSDRILVFDKGKIVEEGTHGDLLAKGGVYARLFRLQSGGFIDDDDGDDEQAEEIIQDAF